MNTLFLLLSLTHGGFWVAGPEFISKNECEVVAKQLDPKLGENTFFHNKDLYKCMPIKKTLFQKQ
jgi:hypothetical protein